MPVARRPEPARTAAPIVENAAAGVVRSYIDALRRGDPQAAASYLANGSPDEGFIGPETRISSLASTRNADGSYSVAVHMQTAGGPYLETFIVAATSEGNRILNKSAGKL